MRVTKLDDNSLKSPCHLDTKCEIKKHEIIFQPLKKVVGPLLIIVQKLNIKKVYMPTLTWQTFLFQKQTNFIIYWTL